MAKLLAAQAAAASVPAASIDRTVASVVLDGASVSVSSPFTHPRRVSHAAIDVSRAAWLRGGCPNAPDVVSHASRTSASLAASAAIPALVRPNAAYHRRARRGSRQPSDLSGRGPVAQRRLRKTGAAAAAGPAGTPGGRVRAEAVAASGADGGQTWDVVGLGQAMVDFAAMVGDDFLRELALAKGSRAVVDHEERGRVLRALDGCTYKLSAGGSLSNTLVALARLGASRNAASASPAAAASSSNGRDCAASAAGGELALRVAMTGSVGSDPLGEFYRTKLRRANVHFLSKPVAGGTTGTVVVLTTPDAQRTMLAYQGMSSVVELDAALRAAVSSARVVVVEGYLWDLPCTVDAIAHACHAAKASGALVALTGSDVTCIARHRPQFWEVMSQSADILFANADEACALLDCPPSTSPAWTALQLSRYCPLVSVTNGSRGAYIAHQGAGVTFVPSAPARAVDTCGAGDAYAAGLLYGLLAWGSDSHKGSSPPLFRSRSSHEGLQQELRMLGERRKSGQSSDGGDGSRRGGGKWGGSRGSSRGVSMVGSSNLMSGSNSPLPHIPADASPSSMAFPSPAPFSSSSAFSASSFPTSLASASLPCPRPHPPSYPPPHLPLDLLSLADVASVGAFAARVAAVVVGQQGARLGVESAAELVACWRREHGGVQRGEAVEGRVEASDLVLE